MKGMEVDFDAIEVGQSRTDVKPKKASGRVNLGSAPDHAKAEYISTGRRIEDGGPEDFIKLDVGEGQEFEALSYNHKLRRKLRRAIENAEIRKEMLVRQRALDHCEDKQMEIPSVLRTPYKPINVKGQRILENGTLETAKQERVRARMDLAEFNTQMRVLRRQAKEAAIHAGLRKHAELIGKIPSSNHSIEQKEADEAQKEHGCDGFKRALEISPTTAASEAATAITKRSRAESEKFTSMNRNSGDQSEQGSKALATSKDYSEVESPTSNYDIRACEWQKEQGPQKDGSKLYDIKRKWTNCDRQVMIDAELALSAEKKRKYR